MAFDKKVSYFLNKYLARIKSIYAPDELWLWGSRAYGNPGEFSDIDLIVVSNKFSGMKFTKRNKDYIRGYLIQIHFNTLSIPYNL